MDKTTLQMLTSYFNEGDGKRSATDWRKEVMALTREERHELATGVALVTGDTLI